MDMTTEQNIVENTHPVEQGKVLKRPRNAETGNLVRRRPGDILAIQRYAACIGRIKAGDGVRQGCLAASVRADQTEDFTPLYIKINGSRSLLELILLIFPVKSHIRSSLFPVIPATVVRADYRAQNTPDGLSAKGLPTSAAPRRPSGPPR